MDRTARLACALFLPALALAAACPDRATVAAGLVSADGAPDRAPPALADDTEVLGVLSDLVAGEIAVAGIGASRASEAVRPFAAQVLAAQAAHSRMLGSLGDRTGLHPAASPLRFAIAEDLRQRAMALAQHDAAGLDRAFLASEVALQMTVRQLLDDEVRPAARDADLLDQILKLRRTVAAELLEAQHRLAALDRPLDAAGEGG
jgi:predicted outer membrane protein